MLQEKGDLWLGIRRSLWDVFLSCGAHQIYLARQQIVIQFLHKVEVEDILVSCSIFTGSSYSSDPCPNDMMSLFNTLKMQYLKRKCIIGKKNPVKERREPYGSQRAQLLTHDGEANMRLLCPHRYPSHTYLSTSSNYNPIAAIQDSIIHCHWLLLVKLG